MTTAVTHGTMVAGGVVIAALLAILGQSVGPSADAWLRALARYIRSMSERLGISALPEVSVMVLARVPGEEDFQVLWLDTPGQEGGNESLGGQSQPVLGEVQRVDL